MKTKYIVNAFGWALVTNFRGKEVRANCEVYKKEFTNKNEAIAAINILKAKRVAWDILDLRTIESFV